MLSNFPAALALVLKSEGGLLFSQFCSRFIQNYLPYMIVVQPKKLPQIFVCGGIRTVHVSYGLNKLIRVFMQIVFFSVLIIKARVSGVSIVFFVRCPFKVFYAIVCFVSVFMINSLSVFTRAKKCLRDHLMSKPTCLGVKRNADVSGVHKRTTNKPLWKISLSPIDVIDFTSQCFKPPQRRNLIPSFKSNNWFPDFGSHTYPLYC